MVNGYRPMNLEDALQIRASEHARVLAGGTDFMVKHGRFPVDERPVLAVSQLKELRQITMDGDRLTIGAACTITELLASPQLPDYLKQPLVQMASPAIRNVATIGGNLCNASPAADALPMLYALDATVLLQSTTVDETLPIQNFILAPGQIRLSERQLLTKIRIPLQQNWYCVYQKAGMRRVNSLSKLSYYALADRSARCLKDIRIAFGAVAPTVVRCREAEQEIIDNQQSQIAELLQQALQRYDSLLHPIDDVRSSNTYRRTVALRLLKQHLTEEMSV